MLKKIYILLLFFFNSCISIKTDYDIALKNYRFIICENSSYGSGVYYNNIIITAKHVIFDDSEKIPPPRIFDIEANEYSYSSIKNKEKISLIYTNTRSSENITISNDIKIGNEVFWIQPIVSNHTKFYIAYGKISYVDDSTFTVSSPIMLGASGTGVWNKNGELIGIMQAILLQSGFPLFGKATRFRTDIK